MPSIFKYLFDDYFGFGARLEFDEVFFEAVPAEVVVL